MKKVSLILSLLLCVSLLAGCAGTPVVYYSDCTCPAAEAAPAPVPTATEAPAVTEAPAPIVEGALKTGMTIVTDVSGSKAAAADAEGEAKFESTIVAVLVDDNGVIQDCIIDGINTSVKFDATGAITTDLNAALQTKNELGPAYNMVAYGNAIAEWNEQAASLAAYVVGKTVEEVQNIAVNEATKPTEADLASSVTISIGGYQAAIAKAVANAQHLGAQAGDTLKLATDISVAKSAAPAEDKAGTAQLDSTSVVLTMNGETITSCTMDSVQAKVGFDAAGALTGDVSAPVATKNELGENYGMVAWGQAIAEWDEQAAAFAAYVTGKTVAQVQSIAVDETTKPTEADLASSVTISIGSYQALVAKAAQ